jgi:hypothetical protein
VFALTADGTVTQWAGRSGKILILLAGLAVLLDLVGPTPLSDWAEKAKKRRDEIIQRGRKLSTVRPLQARATKMPPHAAREVELSSDYFTVAEFDMFARKGHAALMASNWSGAGLIEPDQAAAGIQGRPSASMTRASKKFMLCLVAVDR